MPGDNGLSMPEGMTMPTNAGGQANSAVLLIVCGTVLVAAMLVGVKFKTYR